MRTESRSPIRRLAAACVVLLASLGAVSPARAEEPALVIRLADGGSATYPVTELQRIVFEGDTLVVVKAGGSERYAAATILKIEFSMQYSGIKDPTEAAALLKAVHLFQNQWTPIAFPWRGR
jgi:hypothetical protein